jgi:hypothetical protein
MSTLVDDLERIRVTAKVGKEVVTLKQLDYDVLTDQFREEARKVLLDYAPDIVRRAKENLDERILHPKKSTGRLHRSIGWRPTSRGITIYAGAPYSKFVEDDTRPHIIRAVNYPYLVWTDEGGVKHRAVRVRHPGTKGKHFMRDAVNDYRLALRNRMDHALAQALRRSSE